MMRLKIILLTCGKGLHCYEKPLLKGRLRTILNGCTSGFSSGNSFLNNYESFKELCMETENDVRKKTSLNSKYLSCETVQNELKQTDVKDTSSLNLKDNMDRKSLKQFSLKEVVSSLQSMEITTSSEAVRVLHNLNYLWKLRVFTREKEIIDLLMSTKGMKNLFEMLDRNLTFLSAEELKISFDICVAFRLSESSTLMQKLIKLLISNINSMSTLTVCYLAVKIHRYFEKSNPHTAALHEACDEFLTYCYKDNFYPDESLAKMSYCVDKDCLPLRVREFLLKKVINNDTFHDLPLWSYKCILNGLISPKVFEGENEDLKNKTVKYIKEILKTCIMSDQFVFEVLELYVKGVKNNSFSYNESILDFLASKLVEVKAGTTIALWGLHRLLIAAHFNYVLLSYLNENERFNLQGLNSLNVYQLQTLIKVLATIGQMRETAYIKEALETPTLSKLLKELPKLETALNLAVLDIYNDYLIDAAFTSPNGGELREEDIVDLGLLQKSKILQLHQAVSTFHPNYQGRRLSKSLASKLQLDSLFTDRDNTRWKEVVEDCVGGSEFVLENCTTPLHHFLNFVLVVDEHYQLVDLSNIKNKTLSADEPFDISNIPRSEGTKVIVILNTRTKHVRFRNVRHFYGSFKLYLKVLSTLCDDILILPNSHVVSFDRQAHFQTKMKLTLSKMRGKKDVEEECGVGKDEISDRNF